VNVRKEERIVSWNILIIKANKMHSFSNLLIKYSKCFRQVNCPSSGVSQHCIHAIGICHACLLQEVEMYETYSRHSDTVSVHEMWSKNTMKTEDIEGYYSNGSLGLKFPIQTWFNQPIPDM